MASYLVERTCPVCGDKKMVTYSKKQNVIKHCPAHCPKRKRGQVMPGKYSRIGQKYEHRIIWEKHNGKIPSGYIVHHIDGNRINNNIDNLELLPKKQHDFLSTKTTWAKRKDGKLKMPFSPREKQIDIKKAIELLEIHGSIRKVAEILKITHSPLSHKLKMNNVKFKYSQKLQKTIIIKE
jgi:hypothetical protein